MKRIFAIIVLMIVTVMFFSGNYKSLINNLNQEANIKKTQIDSYIQFSAQLIDDLILYGESFLKYSENSDSKLYNMLKYDPKTNRYDLNAAQNTAYETLVGNLNGIGQIPNEGIYRKEVNLALEFCNFFRTYKSKFQNIDWMYYVSENNFICAYPWAPLSEVKYSNELKLSDAYQLASPFNNPTRNRVWTPAYLDVSGRMTLVTLSKPLYYENQFMGVTSINTTNKLLNNFLTSNHDFYLLDNNGIIIATNQDLRNTGLVSIEKHIGSPVFRIETLLDLQKDSAVLLENNYVYVAKFQDAPWVMVAMIPEWEVISKSVLSVVPLVLIGIFLILSLYEIEKRKETEADLFTQATRDSLTGIYNRRYFMEIFKQVLSAALKSGQNLSLIMIDIDFFKKINDTLGHSKGDEILKKVSSVIRNEIRRTDILCRWGGEEFLVLLPYTAVAQAYNIAERIRKTINETGFNTPWQITCSFGVSGFVKGMSGDDLINKADKALYEAKNSGRNKVVSFEIF